MTEDEFELQIKQQNRLQLYFIRTVENSVSESVLRYEKSNRLLL